jgi:hypothetical protein
LRFFWKAWALAALVVIGSIAPAYAQTDQERASGRALAAQGLTAFKEGRFAEAVDMFTRAESLVHSPTHVIYIARALEKEGKLVKAREAYLKIKRENLPAGAPEAFTKAQQDAAVELEQLQPRIALLKVTVENAPQGELTVTVDGEALPPAVIGVDAPIDPGRHELIAMAPGMKSQPVTIELPEGGRESVTLMLEPDASATTSSGPGPVMTGAGSEQSTSAELDSGGASPLLIGGIVGLGLGAVGLGVGIGFALKSSGKQNEIDDICIIDGTNCPLPRQDEVTALEDDRDSASTLSTVGFILGGVGIATGVTLLVLHGTSGSKETAVTPWIGPRSLGVSGRF